MFEALWDLLRYVQRDHWVLRLLPALLRHYVRSAISDQRSGKASTSLVTYLTCHVAFYFPEEIHAARENIKRTSQHRQAVLDVKTLINQAWLCEKTASRARRRSVLASYRRVNEMRCSAAETIFKIESMWLDTTILLLWHKTLRARQKHRDAVAEASGLTELV